ncbi:MAG TPA: type I restriction endonuclease [Acidobacteriota bacterium]|nr:type I restriction endonuclease [Acidobacteriota bacterium]
MDFVDQLKMLAEQIADRKNYVETEEGTKNSLVMPFIQALGYDVFNPKELVPEFTADVGVKKGEKVDYAIHLDGKPILLFECKAAGTNLDACHASQLYRYFSVTKARVAVLTNGIEYRFFSDLEETNKMDSKPFLVLDLLNFRENLAAELRLISKPHFNLERVLDSAGKLKYMRGVRQLLEEEIENPSEDFVRHFASRVYSGHLTSSVREQFRGVVKRALQDLLRDQITERLQSALEKEAPRPVEEEEEALEDDGIVTTEEEMEGFQIVRAIVSEVVDPGRIAHRDRKTYFAILLDDNARKPICRLWFNTSQKYVGVFDAEKNEERIPIDNLNEIFKLGDRLKAAIGFYD